MNSREYDPEQNIVFTDDGEIINPADATDLPMSNEARIARMHPHVKMDDIQAQRHKEVPLSGDEQALADALEQPEQPHEDVQLVLDARNAFRKELGAKGYSPDRINFMTSNKFGADMARLALKGHDVTPYLEAPRGSEQDAEIHELPQRDEHIDETLTSPVEPEKDREPDFRERQAGPGSR